MGASFAILEGFKMLVMDSSQGEEKWSLPQRQLGHEAALAYACKNKVKTMDLGNHRSAYKCLAKFDGKYKESLQRMGYGPGSSMHNVALHSVGTMGAPESVRTISGSRNLM